MAHDNENTAPRALYFAEVEPESGRHWL